MKETQEGGSGHAQAKGGAPEETQCAGTGASGSQSPALRGWEETGYGQSVARKGSLGVLALGALWEGRTAGGQRQRLLCVRPAGSTTRSEALKPIGGPQEGSVLAPGKGRLLQHH